MEAASVPKQGDVLAGKYRIDRTLGEGGMGLVLEAYHLRLRQRVAIKVLKPNILEHPELVARFEREARAAATLESPYVAKVLDVDTSPEGLPYMVIEFLEGNDLAEELERRGRFPVQTAVAYVMEACVPIAQAHALGIIHRDLKPSNLFLAKKGDERVLKLLDFGISKVLTDVDAKETSSFGVLGTPHYMSPERVRSSADVDRRSDIWSLGVILYELLTGTEPFSGDPATVIAAIAADPVPLPRAKRPDIPVALEAVIMRALEKDPKKRYPDVRSLSVALAPFAPEEELVALAPNLPRSFSPSKGIAAVQTPAKALPITIVAPPAPRRFRRPALWIAPVGALTIGTLGIAWWATCSHADEGHAASRSAGASSVIALSPQLEPTIQPLSPPPASASAAASVIALKKPAVPTVSAPKPTPSASATVDSLPFQL